MTDQELVQGCIAGKASAQKALYDEYAPKMMGLCMRYVGSREDAQDVLQESFVKVFNNMSSFEGKGALGGWIRRIIINTALIHIRKNKKWSFSEDIDTVVNLSVSDQSALEELSAKELMKIINGMPDGYRTVFNLFAIEGYKHKEIADMLDITESTSKTQYRKARVYVQKTLEQLEERSEQI